MAKGIFVSRYKWSHDKLRKKYRKLHKQGKVKRTVVPKGWYYEPIKENSHEKPS